MFFSAVAGDSVKAQGSRPAKLIFSWLNICTSLLERSLAVNVVNPEADGSSVYADSARSDMSTAQSGYRESPSPLVVPEVGGVSSTMPEGGGTSTAEDEKTKVDS